MGIHWMDGLLALICMGFGALLIWALSLLP